eukprot:scaffold26885_cov41-Phaeocystis_antarctica.AAC.1
MAAESDHAAAQAGKIHEERALAGKSVRSDPPRQQPAGDAHAGPHLAGEVLLAQLLLAALVASDLGGRPRLGHGLCPSRSRLRSAARDLLGCLGSTCTCTLRGLQVDAHLAQPEILRCEPVAAG